MKFTIKNLRALILSFAFALIAVSNIAKSKSSKSIDSVRVRVKNWNQRSIITTDKFFERTETQMKLGLGEDLYVSVKKYVQQEAWPISIQFNMGTLSRNPEGVKKFYEKLDRLVLFRLLEFDDINNGKVTKFSLLAAPYAYNKNWDVNSNWDNVYFLFESKYVEGIDANVRN